MFSMPSRVSLCGDFFFHVTATAEIYTLSLHDALPISPLTGAELPAPVRPTTHFGGYAFPQRSEEHTSELHHPSISYAVFCLKKKTRSSAISRKWEISCCWRTT